VAKKSRTPPPPRRVQAPKARTGRDGRDGDERRKFLILIGVAALGFVGIGVVAALFAFGGSGGGAAAIREAGCTIDRYPGQERRHVQARPRGHQYNSFPPSSGPHHDQPAPFDVYEDPVQQIRLIHNLEHGGVVIQYGDDIPQAQVDAMVEWYREAPNGIVIAPLPALNDTIALAAWNAEEDRPGQTGALGEGIVARCPSFDEGAFDAFVDEYGFKGPERFPRELLQPGA